MWWELAIDVLWPSRRARSVERSADSNSRTLRVEFGIPGAFKRRLNESGWLADEVIAAGMLEQGKPHSLLALVTGTALIEVARARRCKSLPREFVLAVTAERVVAFAMSPLKEGDGDTVVAGKIKPGERGSWPRGSVRLIDLHTRAGTRGATLELAGVEPFPVTCDGNPSTDELVERLGR
jgi:hypothetical protein